MKEIKKIKREAVSLVLDSYSDVSLDIGDLLDLLSDLPDHTVIDGARTGPDCDHSYRGFYECLAFEPGMSTVGELKEALSVATSGKVYHGYKGGDYRYDASTPVFIASWGSTGSAISGIMMIRSFSYIWEEE